MHLVLLRVGAGVLGFAGIVLAGIQAAGLWSDWSASDGGGAELVPLLLVALTWGVGFGFLGLVVAVKAKPDRGVLTGGLFFGAFSTFFYGVGALIDEVGPNAPIPFLVAGAFTYAVGVRFAQQFPVALDGMQVSGLGPRWYRGSFGRVLGALLVPWAFWLFTATMETTVHALGAPLLAFGHVITWAALGASYLWIGYRVGREEDRSRSFWILEAALVFVSVEVLQLGVWASDSLGLLALDVRAWTTWLDVLEATVVLACLFFAIFKAGAFDSGLVLKRTAVISASSGLALVLFLVLEETVMEVGSDLLGIQTRTGSILSGVIAAIVFQAVAKRINRALTRSGSTTAESV